jgi:hypothetical protein
MFQSMGLYASRFPSGTDVTMAEAEKLLDKVPADQLRKKGLTRIVNTNGHFQFTFSQSSTDRISATITVTNDLHVSFDHAHNNGVTTLSKVKGMKASFLGIVGADVYHVVLVPLANGNANATVKARVGGLLPIKRGPIELKPDGTAV